MGYGGQWVSPTLNEAEKHDGRDNPTDINGRRCEQVEWNDTPGCSPAVRSRDSLFRTASFAGSHSPPCEVWANHTPLSFTGSLKFLGAIALL